MNSEQNGYHAEYLAESLVTATLIDRYFRWATTRQKYPLAPRTVVMYQKLLKPFIEKFPVLPIDRNTLDEFMADMGRCRTCAHDAYNHLGKACSHRSCKCADYRPVWSHTTRRMFSEPLMAFYRHLASQRMLPIDDDMKEFFKDFKPTVPTELPEYLTEADQAAIFQTCHDPEDRTMMKFLIASGVRPGEACNLDRKDVFPTHVMVYGKTGKRQGERMAPIDQELYNLLQDRPDGPIFKDVKGNRLDANGLSQRAERMMKEAGITKKGASGAYILRHTFGVNCVKAGVPLSVIQQWMGHSNPTTTTIYTRLANPDLANAYAQYNPAGHLPAVKAGHQSTIFDFIEPDDDENQSDSARAESKKASSRDPQNEGIPSGVKA